MNKEQYADWVKPLLEKTPTAGKKLYLEAASEPLAGPEGSGFIEGAVNSGSAERLTLTHFFNFEVGKEAAARLRGVLLKEKAPAKLVAKVNDQQGARFDVKALETFLSAAA